MLRLSCLGIVVVLYFPVSFFLLWVRLFSFVLPPLPLFCVSPLLSFHSALLRFVFFSLLFALVCCVFSILSAALSLLIQFQVSGFPSCLFCAASAFTRGCFHCFCVFASVSSSFSPVRLLQLGFRSPYSLAGCSDVSHPSLSYFSYWFRLFRFFFILVCLSSQGFAYIQQRFSCLSLVCFIGLRVVTCGSPFSSSPSGSFALALALRCLPCNSFASVVFSFSFVFIGLACVVSSLAFFLLAPGVAWFRASLSFEFYRLAYAPSFFVLPVLSALYFIHTILFLLCFPDFVRCFIFLCILLVIVSSIFSSFLLFFFCVFSVVSGASVLRLPSFP